MKITEDVRKYAAEKGVSEEQALKASMEKNQPSLLKREPKFTRRQNRPSPEHERRAYSNDGQSSMHIQIDVWSDYVCPFCYLEESILKRLAQEDGEGLTIRWRAFELRPYPVPTLDPNGTYLRDIWSRRYTRWPKSEE